MVGAIAMLSHCFLPRLRAEDDVCNEFLKTNLTGYEFVVFFGWFDAWTQRLLINEVFLRYELKTTLAPVAVDDSADNVAPVIDNVEVLAFCDAFTYVSQLLQLVECNSAVDFGLV
jgi:hypothetical protein